MTQSPPSSSRRFAYPKAQALSHEAAIPPLALPSSPWKPRLCFCWVFHRWNHTVSGRECLGKLVCLASRMAGEPRTLRGFCIVSLSSVILDFRPRLEACVMGAQVQQVGKKGWLVRASGQAPPSPRTCHHLLPHHPEPAPAATLSCTPRHPSCTPRHPNPPLTPLLMLSSHLLSC